LQDFGRWWQWLEQSSAHARRPMFLQALQRSSSGLGFSSLLRRTLVYSSVVLSWSSVSTEVGSFPCSMSYLPQPRKQALQVPAHPKPPVRTCVGGRDPNLQTRKLGTRPQSQRQKRLGRLRQSLPPPVLRRVVAVAAKSEGAMSGNPCACLRRECMDSVCMAPLWQQSLVDQSRGNALRH